MSDTPLLKVTGLGKQFRVRTGFGKKSGVLWAVRDLSFSLAAGDTLAIVGESGSGKTTTARMIVGLTKPTEGQITLGGISVEARPSRSERYARARKAQIVFQNPFSSLDPRQTAHAAVAEVVGLHDNLDRTARRERVSELLRMVGLGEREGGARPRELSGGQNQRVAIAKALAARPSMLVLDEAVSALDVSVQAQILNLLQTLSTDLGLAYLFITHNLEVVRQVCDRVIVMYRGRAVESGTTDEVLSAPEHPYTRRLLASVPRPGSVWPVSRVGIDDEVPGCVFRARCGEANERCQAEPPSVALSLTHASRCWRSEEAHADGRSVLQ